MVPVDMRFSEKSPSPQPFTEPENMTTIELNKNGYSVDGKLFFSIHTLQLCNSRDAN
jgi:hypothetical protein